MTREERRHDFIAGAALSVGASLILGGLSAAAGRWAFAPLAALPPAPFALYYLLGIRQLSSADADRA